MGTRYTFHCSACDYAAEVSGKVDIGGALKTATVVCGTCKELFDVAISKEPWKQGPDPRKMKLDCPNANGESHTVGVWSRRRQCPRCGTPMKAGGITMCWD